MRFIDISIPTSQTQKVLAVLADHADPTMIRNEAEEGRTELRFMLEEDATQMVMDRVHAVLEDDANWRLAVLSVEAVCSPQLSVREDTDTKPDSGSGISREEIVHEVQPGVRLNKDFIGLSVLSAIVAALGLNSDNVAVVIGAMVIAPLLGPILAFSVGAALGDASLMLKASRTALVGIAIGIATSYALAMFVGVNLNSAELMSRSYIGLDVLALALASGAAAALSLVTGLSSTLVGVMVAVALLPPSVAISLFLGAGETTLAARAGMLLATNVTCVTLASQLVFIVKGVRPRRRDDRDKANRSRLINLAAWTIMLILLAVLAIAVQQQPSVT